MKRNRYFLLVLFFVMLTGFVGCADDTQQAKIEDAKIAIDNRNFSKAISILEDGSFNLQNDSEAASLLASAYMGKAGLNIIKMIEEASKAASAGATGTFTEFSQFFSLSTAELNTQQNDMQAAVALLSGLQNRTPEQNLQLAVAATADIIVTIGADLTNGFQSNGQPNSPPPSTIPPETLTRMTNDVGFVVSGIAGSGIANEDLTKDITTIQSGLTGPNGMVTTTSLNSYLATIH